MHFNFPILPYPNASPQPASEYRYADLNRTTVTPQDIFKLVSGAPDSKIFEYPVYEGFLHPVDGWMVRYGLLEYFGYLIWGMGTTPSWIVMIIISFVSRQIMSRRMLDRNAPDIYARRGQTQAQAQAQAGPASPAGRGTPGGAGKAGKKRR